MKGAIGLDYLRQLRRRGEAPSYPVVVSTVGEVNGNLHVHLNLAAPPADIDWSPMVGLDAVAVIGQGEFKRFLPHAVRLLRYGINQHPGYGDYLYVWDVGTQSGAQIKRWAPAPSPYPELRRDEEFDVWELLRCEAREMKRFFKA